MIFVYFFGKFLVLENIAKIFRKFLWFLKWRPGWYWGILIKFCENFKNILNKFGKKLSNFNVILHQKLNCDALHEKGP